MKIPKLIHQVWLGKAPMHPLMVKWREDWKRLNPDWKLLLWTDTVVEGRVVLETESGKSLSKVRISIGDEYRSLLERSLHLSQQSNIWRYAIVHHMGGLYVDTDVEPILPLARTFDDVSAAAAVMKGEPNNFECGLFASEPHSLFTKDLVESLLLRDATAHGSMGPRHLTEVARRHPSVVALPEMDFLFEYPKFWMEWDKSTAPSSKTIAVHRCSSTWFPGSRIPLRSVLK